MTLHHLGVHGLGAHDDALLEDHPEAEDLLVEGHRVVEPAGFQADGKVVDGTQARKRTLRLSGLTPGTTYWYQIQVTATTEPSGLPTSSWSVSTSTAAASP